MRTLYPLPRLPNNEYLETFQTNANDFRLWEYGRESSPALDALGRFGMTDRLEMQMKAYSQNIRSVIKAHGLQQRSVQNLHIVI